jgi:HPt (histidine-containing phosphotransfer) domain-containing protein
MATENVDWNILQSLKESVGEDFIGVMLETFLEETPQLMADLQNALAANDAEAFRRAAHSMKSNAATFGATRLSELAKELESIAKAGTLSEVGDRLKVLEEALQSASKEIRDFAA